MLGLAQSSMPSRTRQQPCLHGPVTLGNHVDIPARDQPKTRSRLFISAQQLTHPAPSFAAPACRGTLWQDLPVGPRLHRKNLFLNPLMPLSAAMAGWPVKLSMDGVTSVVRRGVTTQIPVIVASRVNVSVAR